MGQSSGKKIPLPGVGETCKCYVARICGTDYVYINPWVDNLAGWTEGMRSSDPFPRQGQNDIFHMDMVKGLCLGDREAFPYYTGDPQWDKEYMRKGGENWLLYAPYWYERADKKIRKRSPNPRDKEALGLHACEKRLKLGFPSLVPCA